MKICTGLAAFDYDLPLEQALLEVEKLEPDHIELALEKNNLAPDEVDRAAKAVHRHGLPVKAVANLGKLNEPDGDRRALGLIRSSIRMADQLGAPFVITYFGANTARSQDQAVEHFATRISACLADAAVAGVTILVENHFAPEPGDVTASPNGCRLLMEAVDSAYFGLNYDPLNFLIAGYEGFPAAYDELLPFIRHVHMKDGRRHSEFRDRVYDGRVMRDHAGGEYIALPLGEGVLNCDGILARLLKDEYQGALTVEAHRHPRETAELYAHGIEFCRSRGLGLTSRAAPR